MTEANDNLSSIIRRPPSRAAVRRALTKRFPGTLVGVTPSTYGSTRTDGSPAEAHDHSEPEEEQNTPPT